MVNFVPGACRPYSVLLPILLLVLRVDCTGAEVSAVVSRSDIILQRPNLKPEQAMPLGNGRLGVAVWAENGVTLQLNRADTLPLRRSPGQVILPGLRKLVEAADYSGRLDLYNGEFVERGGGMKASFYVEPNTDVLTVDVTGVNPDVAQSVILQLWAPRNPGIDLQGGMGLLFELWKDSQAPGAGGATFGSLAAITVTGRAVHAELEGHLGVRLSFLPDRKGTFRLLVAAPHWAGGDALKTATQLLMNAPSVEQHRQWWNQFWQNIGLFQMASKDGTAEYFENLRAVDLYAAAAETRDRFPGSQAGVADLFSPYRDYHKWDPAAYWHFNLRMQVAANLGAGAFKLNEPYFRLYRENLQTIESWTKTHMKGLPGVCVPETIRFNGEGYENETWTNPALNCDATSRPYYNARTLTTGAEISLWIWQQYLATQDQGFLEDNYPVMAEAARFLLAYSSVGKDRMRHTFPSNAHETQWDVRDPATDIAAMQALFPVVAKAANTLDTDADLVRRLQNTVLQIRQLPRVDIATQKRLLSPRADRMENDMIGMSYDPEAPVHNTENIGLEPVWPYSLIADELGLHALGMRTYMHRPNRWQNDWSFDPIHAARLGLGYEVKAALTGITEKYQAYPSGLARFVGPELYAEQVGVVADALQEALVQDYDGTLRIAPAWPSDWDVDGTVYVERRSSVTVQMRSGRPARAFFHAGFGGTMKMRDPWPGQLVNVREEKTGRRINVRSSRGSILLVPVRTGVTYMLEPVGHGTRNGSAPLTERYASGPRVLGPRSIGLLRGGVGDQATARR